MHVLVICGSIQEPLLFLKPTSSYVREGMAIEIPHPCTALDHEVELGVVIGKKGRDIPQHAAMDHISGYALALDMTARELQAVAKQKGLPWTLAKGYDTFTPIGNFVCMLLSFQSTISLLILPQHVLHSTSIYISIVVVTVSCICK
jgi:2-keto-4-pentenoate hydratase/2-oxohepta-3-ene-1,7-dioic acid hydratase in catechol pathway